MNKEEYNKILCDHQAKIEYLNEEMNDFKQTNLPVVKEHIKQQKQLHREWFLEHFDKIWKNRHKFKLGTPYASVIVDGIIITSFACPYYGYVVDKISIGNLIKLWDNSFMFRGYPLIHYRRYHNSDYSSISYIKDRKITSYDYSCRNHRKNNTFRHGRFCRYLKTSATTNPMIWIITELWKNWRKSYSKMISNFMLFLYF